MASKNSEDIVYEDRGEDLGYLRLKSKTPSPPASPTVSEPAPRSSEHLLLKIEAQNVEQRKARAAPKHKPSSMSLVTFIQATVSPEQGKFPHHPSPKKAGEGERLSWALIGFTKDDSPRHAEASPAARTRDNMG